MAVLGVADTNSSHGVINLTPYNSAYPATPLAGRKRRRNFCGAPPPISAKTPNGTVLDIIHEVEEEQAREEDERQAKRRKVSIRPEEERREEALMDLRTVVFSTSTVGNEDISDDVPTSPVSANPPPSTNGGLKVRVGHKYTPETLQRVLFPSSLSPSASSDVEMADQAEIADEAEQTVPEASLSDVLPARPIILETPKETYLFSLNALDDDTAAAPVTRTYDISLILETEVTLVEDDAPQKEDIILDDLATTGTKGPVNEKPASENVALDAPIPKQVDEAKPVGEKAGLDVTNDKEDGEVSEQGDDSLLATAKGPSEPEVDASGDVEMGDAAPASVATPPASSNSRPELALQIPAASNSPLSVLPDQSAKSGPIVLHEAPQEGDLSPDDSFITVARGEDADGNERILHYPVQVLQRGITREMLRFAPDGVYVKDVVAGAGEPPNPEWKIQVVNWKWAGA